MTTPSFFLRFPLPRVVEAYRLDRYDNIVFCPLGLRRFPVGRGRSNVEAYRLDRYDNIVFAP